MSNETSQGERLLRDARNAAALPHKLALLDIEAQHRLSWYRSHYNPDEPRVPKGNPHGGEWTRTGAGDGETASADPTDHDAQLIRIAQAEPPPEGLPRIPKLKPPTPTGRKDVIRAVVEWLLAHGDNIAIEAGHWFEEFYSAIKASFDPPKTLKELQDAVSTPKPGYDIHHIVEQTSAEQDGFPRSVIDDPDNLVLIPRLKHWQITGWYMTKNKAYGGLSPRKYLRDEKNWSKRRKVGLDALVQHGVLKR